MSRQGRIDDYMKPMSWVQGASCNPKNLDYWSRRAEQNSGEATRAKGGKVDLHSTGGKPALRSTSSPPKGLGADPYDRARSDKNSAGSSYMKGIRRTVNGS